MSRIGFIGTGHIAAPMARFLAGKGHEIRVTRRNEHTSAALASEIGAHVAEPQALIDASDTVFLCLRPDVANKVLDPLKFRPGQTVVSVMAGVSQSDLRTLCAPAAAIVQTIPLGFLEQGGCPLAAFGDTEGLKLLFEPENPVVPVASEDALNAHFAICAFVPGVVDMMQTGAGWLAEKTGDGPRAEFYTAQLIAGFLATLDRAAPGTLARERDALATPGTLSLMMTDGLRFGGAHDALTDTLDRIARRLERT